MKNNTYRKLRKRLTVLFLCCSFVVLGAVSILIAILSYSAGYYGNQGALTTSDFLLFYLQHAWEVNLFLYVLAYILFLYVFIGLFYRNMNILVSVLEGNTVEKVPFFFRILPEFQIAKDKVEDMIAKRNESKQLSIQEKEHKNELLMYLAHDLKTPLTSMIGYINHILDHHVDGEQMEKSLSIANEKAHRLDELIEEFEEILRYDDKVSMLDVSPLDICALIKQQVNGFYPLMEKRNIKAQVDIPDALEIEADYDKLQRLLDNLMRNAITYSDSDSIIYIGCFEDEKQITLEYRNDGEEIDEEAVSHLFEKFYRASTARTSSSGGAGLGLAIAKEIVELHHGVIDAHKEGKQIVFTIRLWKKLGGKL